MGITCRNCGAVCQDGSTFCARCSTPLVSCKVVAPKPRPAPDPGPLASTANTPGFFRRHWLALVMTLVIIALIVSAAILYNYVTSPKRVAEQYMEYLCGDNLEDAYSMLALDGDNPYTTLDHYADFLARNTDDWPDFSTIQNYDISLSRSNADVGAYSYTVQYVCQNGKQGAISVNLIQGEDKKFLIFPTYQVSTVDMVSDFTITAPAYAAITLDGAALDPELGDLSEDGSTRFYALGPMFRYDHDIIATHPLTETCTGVAMEPAQINPSNMPLTEETKAAVFEKARADGDAMLEEAVKGSTLENEGLAEGYLQVFYNRFYGLRDVSVTSCEDRTQQETLGENMTYTCILGYAYTYREYLEDAVYVDFDDAFEVALTYTYQNDTWRLTAIN